MSYVFEFFGNKETAEVFEYLSELKKPRTIGQISVSLDISQNKVEQSIKTLEEKNLIKQRGSFGPMHNTVLYGVTSKSLEAYNALESLRKVL
ncbi:MAG: winged helix-turn-helix transcriptional regulator [Candidatus Aenigmarchaeota archaeon]|nr:winged helix-turn-helix transcriptional regulator [Candidatus Aenigmarchaeota archaeon]